MVYGATLKWILSLCWERAKSGNVTVRASIFYHYTMLLQLNGITFKGRNIAGSVLVPILWNGYTIFHAASSLRKAIFATCRIIVWELDFTSAVLTTTSSLAIGRMNKICLFPGCALSFIWVVPTELSQDVLCQPSFPNVSAWLIEHCRHASVM